MNDGGSKVVSRNSLSILLFVFVFVVKKGVGGGVLGWKHHEMHSDRDGLQLTED